MPKIASIILLVLAIHTQASPVEAERIKRGFELASEAWDLKLKMADSAEIKSELLANRPDRTAAAAELWTEISPALKEDWTIPYAAFFLDLTRNLTAADAQGNTATAFSAERSRILAAFTESHLSKPGIAPFCIALADSGDPKSLQVLEKIIETNPDEPTQGIAALGAALLLKNLGDAPEVMQKRLTYIRKAIIAAADQSVGGTSVADIATDELYVIRFLAKGRVAPDFTGIDVSGKAIRLADLRGKIAVVLFWDAKSPETDKVIALTNQLAEKYAGKPVAILGITPEAGGRIRELQGDGSIKWNNIIDPTDKLAKEYRIATRPALLVLDPQGKIEYTGLPGSFAELTVDALLAGDGPEK